MGNRAVITTEGKGKKKIGVYLHWNGGRDSVEAFLIFCKLKEFRTPESDNYGWARLTQVIANFFGGDGLSIGVDTLDKLDCNGDNGVYIIKNWEIVGRENFDYGEQRHHDLKDMLHEINNAQPEGMKLSSEVIDGYEKPSE